MSDVLVRLSAVADWPKDDKDSCSSSRSSTPPPPPYAEAPSDSESDSSDRPVSPVSDSIFSFDDFLSSDDDKSPADTTVIFSVSSSSSDDESEDELCSRRSSSDWNSGSRRRPPPPRLDLQSCQGFASFASPVYHFSPRHQCYAETGVTVPFGPTPLISPQHESGLSPSDLEAGYAVTPAATPIVPATPYVETDAHPILLPYYDASSAHAMYRADMRARWRMAAAVVYTLVVVVMLVMAWQVWGVEIGVRVVAQKVGMRLNENRHVLQARMVKQLEEGKNLLSEEWRYHWWQIQGFFA
ncbi:hypothetical protein HGRIS_010180 [Hohenbuehelia grisea]|uniref:Uncharacterized protein n=1 Tax=Hohenbuehelia grisea TaxID=104357 RepID=A0ABR3J3P6_9AGAR